MKFFSKEEYADNNCTLCTFFKSFAGDYFDDKEPEDQGFCRNGRDEAGADLTCDGFESKAVDSNANLCI